MKEKIKKYSHCFVCGDKNEVGLKVQFYYEDGKAKAEYTAPKEFQGYKGYFTRWNNLFPFG